MPNSSLQYVGWFLWPLFLVMLLAMLSSPVSRRRLHGRMLILKGRTMIAIGNLLMRVAQSLERPGDTPVARPKRPFGHRLLRQVIRAALLGLLGYAIVWVLNVWRSEKPSFLVSWLILSCGLWISEACEGTDLWRRFASRTASLGAFVLANSWIPAGSADKARYGRWIPLVLMACIPIWVFMEIGLAKWWSKRTSKRICREPAPPAA